jgi:hypothetical protein
MVPPAMLRCHPVAATCVEFGVRVGRGVEWDDERVGFGVLELRSDLGAVADEFPVGVEREDPVAGVAGDPQHPVAFGDLACPFLRRVDVGGDAGVVRGFADRLGLFGRA